jgi:hypothetical protein
MPFVNVRMTQLALGVAAAAVAARPAPLRAQTARDSVVATVQEFFRAMSVRDTAAAKAVMRMDGQLYAVWQGPDSLVVQRVLHQPWVSQLAGGRGAPLERMWEPTVLVRGPVAMLWTAYDFHVDGKFSHCGADAFTLIRSSTGWKISSVAFTLERKGCTPSPLGPPPRR